MTAVKIRGKSELRRTGCRITSGGGDSKESATEIYRRVSGKGGKARQELTGALGDLRAL